MPNTGSKLSSVIICTFLCLLTAEHGRGATPSNVLEKTFAFPSPLQWRAAGAEISLLGLAWGPANSAEMQAKGREKTTSEKPAFFDDRPYALTLMFRAKLDNVVSAGQASPSRLALVKNVEGDLEVPSQLTPSGFVRFPGSPATYDMRFNQGGVSEFWDFFPVSPSQKEFLFQVSEAPSSNKPMFAFRIILRDGGFVIVNAMPTQSLCPKFKKNFAGTIGSGSTISAELTRDGETINGTEKYARIGQSLWLQGSADSLDNFSIEEHYPKDYVTGIFKGKFLQGCQVLSGYFSKPDGSRLQPFELREVGRAESP